MNPSTKNDARLCMACLARNEAVESCVHCKAALVFGGHFVAREPLSEKRSSRTLEGVDLSDGTRVILKCLSVSGLSDWKELELFQRGISVLRGLDHVAIPRHLHDGEFKRGGETFFYWVQERIDGPNLADALERGQRWTEAKAKRLAAAMVDVLTYLQGFSPPIIHRDIKPANILERGEDDWVLIDFDLVKDTLDPEGSSTTALGTAGFAPIEQLMGHALPASDLYGLGATLVALLSRKSPADLVDPGVGRIEFGEHVNVSDRFGEFMATLLEPQADERPVDARAARELLVAMTRSATPHAAARPSDEPGQIDTLAIGPSDSSELPSTALDTKRNVGLAKLDRQRAARVQIHGELTKSESAPMWLNVARVALVVATVAVLKSSLPVAAAMGAAAWVVGSLVLRWPVDLEPGRALYRGGISHETQPGRYWLRKPFFDTPYTAVLDTLHLRWRPASSRIDADDGETRWLDFEVELWIRPADEDVEQFGAILKLGSWADNADMLAQTLRDSVLDVIVDAMSDDELWEASVDASVDVSRHLRAALNVAIEGAGFCIVAHGSHEARLGPRGENPRGEDVVTLRPENPPGE